MNSNLLYIVQMHFAMKLLILYPIVYSRSSYSLELDLLLLHLRWAIFLTFENIVRCSPLIHCIGQHFSGDLPLEEMLVSHRIPSCVFVWILILQQKNQEKYYYFLLLLCIKIQMFRQFFSSIADTQTWFLIFIHFVDYSITNNVPQARFKRLISHLTQK